MGEDEREGRCRGGRVEERAIGDEWVRASPPLPSPPKAGPIPSSPLYPSFYPHPIPSHPIPSHPIPTSPHRTPHRGDDAGADVVQGLCGPLFEELQQGGRGRADCGKKKKGKGRWGNEVMEETGKRQSRLDWARGEDWGQLTGGLNEVYDEGHGRARDFTLPPPPPTHPHMPTPTHTSFLPLALTCDVGHQSEVLDQAHRLPLGSLCRAEHAPQAVVQLPGLGELALSADGRVGAPEVGERRGVGQAVEHLGCV
jgi:hypothetical protein